MSTAEIADDTTPGRPWLRIECTIAAHVSPVLIGSAPTTTSRRVSRTTDAAAAGA